MAEPPTTEALLGRLNARLRRLEGRPEEERAVFDAEVNRIRSAVRSHPAAGTRLVADANGTRPAPRAEYRPNPDYRPGDGSDGGRHLIPDEPTGNFTQPTAEELTAWHARLAVAEVERLKTIGEAKVEGDLFESSVSAADGNGHMLHRPSFVPAHPHAVADYRVWAAWRAELAGSGSTYLKE